MIWSLTRISQCRLAEYGHWMVTCMPAFCVCVTTPVVSKVRPGTIVGAAVFTWSSAIA